MEMTDNEMRKSFERWYSDDGINMNAIERRGEGYKLMQAETAWSVWRAAQLAAAPEAQQERPTEKQIEAAIWHLKGSHEDFALARRLIRRIYEGEMPPAAPAPIEHSKKLCTCEACCRARRPNPAHGAPKPANHNPVA